MLVGLTAGLGPRNNLLLDVVFSPVFVVVGAALGFIANWVTRKHMLKKLAESTE